jgi:FixJ family two-component response regulator
MRAALEDLVGSIGLQVKVFASPQEFLNGSRPEVPGCLVLDVRLPGMSGLTFQKELARAGSDLPIIFITGHGDIPMSVRAMKAGAVEFLTKPFHHQDLLDAINAAIERDIENRRKSVVVGELRSRQATLTERERQIMKLVVSGKANKQIAFELGLSEMTVKVHRGQVMRKMQASSLPDLVRMSDRLESSSTSS